MRAVVLLGVMACRPAAEPATVEAFCADVAAAVCDGFSACDCRFDLRPYDAVGCAAARAADCEASLGANVGADLDAGRAELRADAIDRCVAAIRAEGCDLSTSSWPAACGDVVVDVAEVGAACSVRGGGLAFCADGAGVCEPGGTLCVARPGPGDACPIGVCADGLACDAANRCVTPGSAGADCAIDGECADGLVCAPGGSCASPLPVDATCERPEQCDAGLVCDGGVCEAAAALGGACDGPAACGTGRACARAPETRTCADPLGLGDVCAGDGCDVGLACAEDECVALPGDGDPCLDGFACDVGLTCEDGVGTCRPLPALGETCAVGNRFCADGLGCDPNTNTCQEGPGVGQMCLLNPPDYVCADGLGCDFGGDGSVCVTKGDAGDPCTNDRVCDDGTYCEFSTLLCATYAPIGASCEDGNECGPAATCAPGPSGYTCEAIPGADAPCVDVCVDGLTCQGAGGECAPLICILP